MDIIVTWKHTNDKCTAFRTIKSLARWLGTARSSVTSKQGPHPRVDLRDVDIPQPALNSAYFELLNIKEKGHKL